MGWELRVFCPAETAKNVFGEDVHHKERREDEYILVSSRVGLKKRGGSRWEVKTKCGESNDCPGLERWCKDSVESVDCVDSIIRQRGVLGEEELLGLERRIHLKVEKERDRRWVGGVLMEQTDLKVKWGGKTEMCRSWCVAGSKDEVENCWRQNWATLDERDSRLGKCSLVMGYPEWLGVVAGVGKTQLVSGDKLV